MSLKVEQIGRRSAWFNYGNAKFVKKMANHWRRQQWRRDVEANVAKLYKGYAA